MSNISNKNIGLKKGERNSSSVLDKTPHSRKYKNEEKLSEAVKIEVKIKLVSY